MSLVSDNETEIRFLERGTVCLYIGAIFYLIFFYLLFKPVHDPSDWILRCMLLGVGLVFTILSTIKEEIVFEPKQGTYTYSKGSCFGTETKTGLVKELEGVEISVGDRHGNSSGSQLWTVALRIPGMPSDIILSQNRDELKAYRDLDLLVKRVGVRAGDHTRTADVVKRALESTEKFGPLVSTLVKAVLRRNELPTAVASNEAQIPSAAQTASVIFPPWNGSARIHVKGSGRRKMIDLPPEAFDSGARWRFIFAAVGGWGGLCLAFFLYMWLGGNTKNRGLTILELVLALGAGSVMALLDMGRTWGKLQRLNRRTTIEDLGGAIRFYEDSWGQTPRISVFCKKDIQDIVLKPVVQSHTGFSLGFGHIQPMNLDETPPPPGTGQELEVRTGSELIRIANHMSAQDLEWLCQAVKAMAQDQ